MKEKRISSLGFKFSIIIMVASLLIGALVLLASNHLYTQQANELYANHSNLVEHVGEEHISQYIAEAEQDFIGRMVLETVAVSSLVAVIFLIILRRLLIKPINQIANAASNYLIEENANPLKTSSLQQLSVSTQDELQSLSESLKAMEEKIQHHVKDLEKATYHAETDSMTTLYNREAFEKRVSEILKSEGFDGSYVFMMIDLDNLKQVNDEWGHHMGDDIIAACSKAIKSNFRNLDLVSRIGGDEFAVFYKSPRSLADIERRAQALCSSIKKVVVHNQIKSTISIGVAVVDGNETYRYQELYIMADEALYSLKEKGRDGFVIREAPPANQRGDSQ